jgi:hypothetical protein
MENVNHLNALPRLLGTGPIPMELGFSAIEKKCMTLNL